MSSSMFDCIPDEIVEIILGHLPFNHLNTARSVCKRWKRIITRPQFQYWKKTFNTCDRNLLSESVGTFSYISEKKLLFESNCSFPWEDLKGELIFPLQLYLYDCRLEGDPYPSECRTEYMVPQIVHAVSQHFKSLPYESIKHHRKYSWAAHVIKQYFRFALDEEGQVNNVAAIVVICFLAKDVWDIMEIVELVQHPQTEATTLDISELLFCIAKFLKNEDNFDDDSDFLTETIPELTQIRFMVHQALFFIENNWPFDPTFKFTPEQERIINFKINPDDDQLILKIVGFAGTGKTTALMQLCEKNPDLKFLMVVFNKSAKDHASKLFPKNVKCMTVCEIGRQMTKGRFADKMTFKFSEKVRSNLNRECMLSEKECVISAVETFVHSRDSEITDEHAKMVLVGEKYIHPPIQSVVKEAKALWSAISDEHNQKVCISEDEVLKVLQLEYPDLREVWAHDVLLVEEGHAMSECLLDIFEMQETPKIMAGDRYHMFSYGHPETSNFYHIESDHTIDLRQNFRYGPEIAFAARSLFNFESLSTSVTPIGNMKVDRVLMERTLLEKVLPGQTAIISCTSGGLFDYVAKIMYEPGPRNIKGHFIGGVESYDFQDLVDLQKLRAGQIKVWKSFKSFEEFVGYCYDHVIYSAPNGNENVRIACDYAWKVKIVKKYGHLLRTALKMMTKHHVDDPEEADFVYGTVDKTQGCEWDMVVLVDDFARDPKNWLGEGADGEPNYDLDDVSYLLYGAITRAKRQLTANKLLTLSYCDNAHFFDEHIVALPDFEGAVLCKDCKVPICENSGIKLIIKTSGDKYICANCATKRRKVKISKHGEPIYYTEDVTRVLWRYFVCPDKAPPPLEEVSDSDSDEDTDEETDG